MDKTFDAITVGNATVDLFFTIQDTNEHFRVNDETKELCIRQGDKVLIDNAKFLLGGNASNVAVGLRRLGLNTAIFAEIGQDEFSEKIINGLIKEEVEVSWVIKSLHETSPFSVILNYKGERTVFSEDTEKDHDFNFNNCHANWIYLTSLGKKWMEAYKNTLEFAKKTDAKIVFNPGASQIDAGENHVSNVLEHAEILIVNKEEGLKIINKEKIEIEQLLKNLKNCGPRIVVVTDGQNGAHCIDVNEQIFYQAPRGEEVVERTGAGDAFSTGFLAAMIKNKEIKEAMFWGAKNSASVISKIGAQPGLLRGDEISV
jgi:ribokinase